MQNPVLISFLLIWPHLKDFVGTESLFLAAHGIVRGLARPSHLAPPTKRKNCVFLVVYLCFLILDTLTPNKLLRITGFETLYLLYQHKFFSDFAR